MGSITLPNQPAHTSYSSFNTWLRCGNQWYLEKVVKVDSVPNWAMVGGSALHKATEDFDNEYELCPFEDYMDEQVESQMKRNPSIDPSEYRATGRASKEWPNKHDLDWWLVEGPKMVQGYIDWRSATKWPIWTAPGNMPAIELQMNFQLPDGPPMKAFIDRIFEPTKGIPTIVDIKSGRPPDNTMQNGVYATGCEIVFNTRPHWGSWWSPTKSMSHTEPHNLDKWTPAMLGELYNQFVRAVNNNIFVPHVTSMCGSCGVNKYCSAYGGSDPKDVFAPLVGPPF